MRTEIIAFMKPVSLLVFFMVMNSPQSAIAQQLPVAADTVELTSLKHWPQPIKQVPPEYPPLAQQDKVEAEIMLNVLIGTDGKPKNVKVLNVKTSFMKESPTRTITSVPAPTYSKLFHKPSVHAVMNWRFTKPLKPDSSGALVWVKVPLKYQLTLQK